MAPSTFSSVRERRQGRRIFGPRSAKPEPEPEEEKRDLTPTEEVYATRYIRLLALHIDPDDALRLIKIPDVAHQAERLYDLGCPAHLIVRLLEGD